MRGSDFLEITVVKIKRVGALRKTSAALLAGHFLFASSLSGLMAHPGEDHEHCAPKKTREQSIVISSKSLPGGEASSANSSTVAVVADATDTLEPIAKVSEYEPDLAEPLVVARVPTLADPITPAKQLEQPAPLQKKQTDLAVTADAEAISFHGVTPGSSKRINVLRIWGDPRSDDTQAAMLKYRFDDLPSVDVYFAGDQVDSIVVGLAKPKLIAKLRKKLGLMHLRPLVVKDGEGEDVAEIYPERGVVMRYASEERGLAIVSDQQAANVVGPRIREIVIQPIEAEPFVLRAAKNSTNHFTYAIADLEAALRVDRTLVAARAQLSEIHLKIGQAVTAERYAAEAVESEPQNAAYRLQWAKCLRQLARYDRAVVETRQVLESPNVSTLLRAQALNEMGMLASLGSQKVARRAMPLHSKAIELADDLAVSDDLEISRLAKQLLVEAHLAVAVEISRGNWQEKDVTVPQWIERASGLAEALIDEDPTSLPLRLQVAVSSLAAAANLDKPINPLLWVEEAEGAVAQIKTDVFDVLTVNQYEWQLGLAYFHGAQIEHRRSQPDSAIRLGELADQQLGELAKNRDEMPDTAYLMGRLYFQIGAVHAVHYDDHASACLWYDQASDRLINPVPVTTMAEPGQHGDALVSMGVSYWSQGEHQRATEVTEAGMELVEQAVSSGLLKAESLNVPYTNLSAMYAAQGEKESATRYEQLAREITNTKVSQLKKVKRK